ncbi:hypothetical protein ES702_06817 [subsurface metagenome]
MSAKLATRLRVTPSPTTLAESSAIYQALSKQGRVSVFARCKGPSHEQVTSTSSSTFFAIFSHEPPTLRTSFEVPVYHGLPSARDEDPFNIRGLQDRKPMPASKSFSCVIEKLHQREVKSQEEAIIRGHPYHGHFAVEKDGWLEDVLVQMNAPPGVARGCGIRKRDDVFTTFHDSDGRDEVRPKTKGHKINMGSVMDMWREATGRKKNNTIQEGSSEGSAGSKRGPARFLLNADTPLGNT